METFTDPSYLTGLLEVAGSFNFNRGRNQWNVVFAVALGGENRELLERMRSYFDGGRIYPPAGGSRVTRCSYRVTRPAELLRVVEHFERHPLIGVRKNEFAIWREMVLLRAASIGQAQPEQMEELAKRLSEQRISRSGHRKIVKRS